MGVKLSKIFDFQYHQQQHLTDGNYQSLNQRIRDCLWLIDTDSPSGQITEALDTIKKQFQDVKERLEADNPAVLCLFDAWIRQITSILPYINTLADPVTVKEVLNDGEGNVYCVNEYLRNFQDAINNITGRLEALEKREPLQNSIVSTINRNVDKIVDNIWPGRS